MKLLTWLTVFLLVPAAFALQITLDEPHNATYNTVDVLLQGYTDNVSDSIQLQLDDQNYTELCTNCTAFNTSLQNLSIGTHTVEVTASRDNETATANVDFNIDLDNGSQNDTDLLVLSLTKPENKTYTTQEVPLEIVASYPTNIFYALDNQTPVLACENCTLVQDTLENISEGTHTLLAYSGNVSETVSFAVALEDELQISIHEPAQQTYAGDVPVNVSTNRETDLYYRLDNISALACQNCSQYHTTLTNLSVGPHTLEFYSGNVLAFVNFTMFTNQDDPENESAPRFDRGFNKLPQALESGEITNEQLQEILRENKLNPGVLNRLAKTGLLEQATIDLMVETQFAPRGILQKLLGWLITDNDDVVDTLFEEYQLTEQQQAAIVANQQGISKGKINRIAKSQKLLPGAINKAIDRNPSLIKTIAEHQTMEKENIEKALSKGLDKKQARVMVENQVLDDSQKDRVAKQWGNDKSIGKALKDTGKGKANAPGQNKAKKLGKK